MNRNDVTEKIITRCEPDRYGPEACLLRGHDLSGCDQLR